MKKILDWIALFIVSFIGGLVVCYASTMLLITARDYPIASFWLFGVFIVIWAIDRVTTIYGFRGIGGGHG